MLGLTRLPLSRSRLFCYGLSSFILAEINPIKGPNMKTISLFLFLIGSACASPELPYSVLQEDGKIEVRQYDSYLTASVSFDSEEELEDNGFSMLADYIFGNNIPMTSPVFTEGENIGMTSPVFTQGENIGMTSPVFTEGDDIGMTSPVFTGNDSKEWTMTFVMPERYTLETLPRPTNKEVLISEVPASVKASIRFNGRRTQRRTAKFEGQLRDWIKKQGMTITSEAIYAGHNPPWTLPIFRRNEVLFEVK